MSIFLLSGACWGGMYPSFLGEAEWEGTSKGRHTFFFHPESEAILGGWMGLRLLCLQEQGTEGYHGWMRLVDLNLQEVTVCAVAWSG